MTKRKEGKGAKRDDGTDRLFTTFDNGNTITVCHTVPNGTTLPGSTGALVKSLWPFDGAVM